MPWKSKERRKQYEQENRRAIQDRQNERNRYRTRLIQRWKQIKGCSHPDCKDKHWPFYALHLDHINPADRTFSSKQRSLINKIADWSMENIKKELAKCQVLCANHHAIKTYEENDYGLDK